MWECPNDLELIQHDYTYGDGYKTIKLYETEPGWRIKSINEEDTSTFQNIDQKHDRTDPVDGTGPVSEYLIEGDTSGDDLGSSYVRASFKELKITLEEVGDCIPN